jgi:hypothetical protein
VNVAVNSCVKDGSGIVADPDPVKVAPGEKTMLWVINTQGFKFPKRDAITFKPETKAASDKHIGPCKARGTDDTMFECKNKNNAPATIKYNITVLKKDGSACATKDPIIINEN